MTALLPVASSASPIVASRCRWCGGAAQQPVWTTVAAEAFQPVRCTACGLVTTWPALDDDQLAGYYPASYYGAQSRRFYPWMERLVDRFRQRRARRLDRLVAEAHGARDAKVPAAPQTAPRRVLDIGCGRGQTLAGLRRLGWQTAGVELNETAACHARDVLKLDVRTGGFLADDWPAGAFDAVICWHVLEHLTDPRGAVAGIAQLLKPGGVLALAVPNWASWQARATRRHWFHLDLPRHVSHFEADWLGRELKALGFEVVSVSHLSHEQNVFGWVQSLLNRCGLPHNLLYDLLRRSDARHTPHPWRAAPVASALSLLGLGLLLLPALLLSWAEALVGQGGTIELYAVRHANDRLAGSSVAGEARS